MNSAALLIVEDDLETVRLLALNASERGYRVLTASSAAAADRALRCERVALAIVDLTLGQDCGFEVMRAIKAADTDTKIIVISGSTSIASAIESYDRDAFAYVQKPFDLEALFDTIEKALDHRRVVLANRRLLWEQTLVNDLSNDLRALLPPAELVERVLNRLGSALELDATACRLCDANGRFDQRFITAPEAVRAVWSTEIASVHRPSDTVLATLKAVRTDDLHAALMPEEIPLMPLRSTLSVPMFAGDQLLGVLSVGSLQPRRFTEHDERLLGVVANHVAVAVQNAQLHLRVRQGKQDWEATFDAIGDPIAVFDRDGRIVRGNSALAAHLRRPLTSLQGLTCDEVGLCGGTHPDCAVGRSAGTMCVQAEVTLPGERIFNVTTCPVEDAHDTVAVVQIAKDVTEPERNAQRIRQMSEELSAANSHLLATVERLKTTQAQLLQAEKLSAIGQLVAGVAHELNNPLTSVIGYAQLLQDEFSDPAQTDLARPLPEVAVDLRRIAEESERAARIVRNLLAFARRHSAARALQDVGELVARVLALRTYEMRLNGVELRTEIDADLPGVLGDAGQLQQALLNLVLNAEQAMRSRAVRRLTVGARPVRNCDAVEVFVSDSGHGIAEEDLRRVFDPFFTTRAVGEGTGLGLSICYGIVRDHGGQIGVTSRVGVGTTFSLLLPAQQAAPLASALVAHRDPTERDYVAAVLAGWGHRVAAAESADDARARLRAGDVEVALIDRALMTDPAEWTSAVAARGTSIVVMTDAAGGMDAAFAGRTEARAVVAAPFELAALRAALRGVTQECV